MESTMNFYEYLSARGGSLRKAAEIEPIIDFGKGLSLHDVSLEQAAAARVIIVIFNQLSTRIPKFIDCIGTNYHFIMDCVQCEIDELVLPTSLRNMLRTMVTPMIKELFDWMEFFSFLWNFRDRDVIAGNGMVYVTWTNRGTIDYPKTAENILDNMKGISDESKYELACKNYRMAHVRRFYGAGRGLPAMADQLACETILNLPAGVSMFQDRSRHHIETKEDEMFFKFAWNQTNGNLIIDDITLGSASLDSPNLFCFLMSQLKPPQQKIVIKKYLFEMIIALAGNCLWSDFSGKLLNRAWHCLSEEDFSEIITQFLEKDPSYLFGCEEMEQFYLYGFQQIWKSAPRHYRDHMLESNDGYAAIYALDFFNQNSPPCIKLMLESASEEQIVNIYHTSLKRASWLNDKIHDYATARGVKCVPNE